MGATSTLKTYSNDIAKAVQKAYVTELKKHNLKFDFPQRDDLKLETSVDVVNGVYIIKLSGLVGTRLNNPTVGVEIPTDLLRQLRKGGPAYNKSISHFPEPQVLESLVFDRLMQLKLDDILGYNIY